MIRLAEDRAYILCKAAQDGVARLMTISVVHLLEMVEIHDEKRMECPIFQRTVKHRLTGGLNRLLIQKPRQGIQFRFLLIDVTRTHQLLLLLDRLLQFLVLREEHIRLTSLRTRTLDEEHRNEYGKQQDDSERHRLHGVTRRDGGQRQAPHHVLIDDLLHAPHIELQDALRQNRLKNTRLMIGNRNAHRQLRRITGNDDETRMQRQKAALLQKERRQEREITAVVLEQAQAVGRLVKRYDLPVRMLYIQIGTRTVKPTRQRDARRPRRDLSRTAPHDIRKIL